MLGAIVNTVSILLGGVLGCGLGSTLSKRYSDILLNAIAISVVSMGLKRALETENTLLVICCMALGCIIGEFLGIEERLKDIGGLLEDRFSSVGGNIAEGFITSVLVFCVGAMSIIGAIESGISNNHTTLFAKSVMDGVTSIVFASTLGVGVPLAAVPVLIYEGSISLISGFVAPYLPMEALNELSAIGGLLVMVIGLNILKITKIKVANMLPSVFLPVLYFLVF